MKKYQSISRRRYLTNVGIALLAASGLASRKASARTSRKNAISQPRDKSGVSFIRRAFEMRDEAIANGDQGYGAVVVLNGEIVGQAASHVVVNNDPTAHAEMEAIRDAASRLGNRNLDGCTLYSSSRACPMCEAAAYWASIDRMVFSDSVVDAGRPALCS